MVAQDAISNSLGSDFAPHEHARVWGMSTLEAHDRMWASRGVQIVRTLGEAPPMRGPDIYLLIEADTMLWFDLTKVMRRMHWLKPRAIRLRIVDHEKSQYSEVVVYDQSDRFERIERGYQPATHTTGRVVITAEYSLAEHCWRQASSATEGWRRIKDRVDRSTYAVSQVTGQYLNASRDEAVGIMYQHWRNPRASGLSVYRFDKDVWIHDSVKVPQSALLIGPLWVGAGSVLEPGDVIIGPATLHDVSKCAPPRAVDYETLKRGSGRLFPALEGVVRSRRISKRIFDLLFALAMLVLTLPLYPIIALAILVEDGRPIFFAHIRQTIHGKQFPCLKFRTMCRNADVLKTQLVAANQADGPQFYIEDDPRLLRVGKFLRKFQLDELPQFWNVLLGHMSVVGPRPSPDKENQYCPTWREARLSVRPGVTGLWQVQRTREPETDFQEWIQFDLEYVQHQSWKLDILIIIRTIRHIVGG
jgi:lipopolysaccharide/colanic/teichoic acid biosynthesis glycosyltransferase